jgi:hypothetical protein
VGGALLDAGRGKTGAASKTLHGHELQLRNGGSGRAAAAARWRLGRWHENVRRNDGRQGQMRLLCIVGMAHGDALEDADKMGEEMGNRTRQHLGGLCS